MPPQKPDPHFSKAAENNKTVILQQLRKHLRGGDHVLEIASGTAQHALHFSAELPDIHWQPSDVDLELYGLREIISENPRDNLAEPLRVDVSDWPDLPKQYDAVYSANCLHIIDWPKVETCITGAARSLKPGGLLLFYGPFKYGGEFTTASNQQFDGFLKSTWPGGGIRDFEAIAELAKKAGFSFVSDTAMPANNQFLVWKKQFSGQQ